jgi:peptide methionine sulfoxide reductase MsrB
LQLQVLRLKATEPRSVTVARGGFDDHEEDGTYVCGCCGTPLYDSSHKVSVLS